jgi:hypothetical protein
MSFHRNKMCYFFFTSWRLTECDGGVEKMPDRSITVCISSAVWLVGDNNDRLGVEKL